MAPPASFNVQEVPALTDRVATPVRARVMGGGGWFAGCLVGGRGGEGGGEMVLGGWGGGKDGFCGGWFCILFSVGFFKRLHPKKTVCLFHCLKSKL